MRYGIIVPAIAVVGLAVSTAAATLTVDLNGGGDYTDIQSAIDAAGGGDTVVVKPGEYVIHESINFNRLFNPNDPFNPPLKNIEMHAEAGPKSTVIRMTPRAADAVGASVVVFANMETAASKLSGFTLTGGDTTQYHWGGGISFRSGTRAQAENCVITGNIAKVGGGICAYESYPTVRNCTVSGNVAEEDGGGIFLMHGRPTVVNCIVWGNAGGGVAWGFADVAYLYSSCVEGPLAVPGEHMIRDDPRFFGFSDLPEVYVDSHSAEPGNGTLAHPFRSFASAVGGFRLSLTTSSPCLGAGEGGVNMGADMGVEVCGGSLPRTVRVAPGVYDIAGAWLTQNVSIEGSGSACTILEGTVFGLRTGCSIRDVTVTHGARGGMVVSMYEAPEVVDSVIAENHSEGNGGGLMLLGAPIATRCTIAGNAAKYGGGGVFCMGEGAAPVFRDCVITGNWADGSEGGGLFCSAAASATLVNCVLSGNGASGGAGAVASYRTNLSLVNCTVADNWAPSKFTFRYLNTVGSPNVRVVNTVLAWLWQPLGEGTPVNCTELVPCFTACIVRRSPLFVRPGDYDFTRFKPVELEGIEYSFPDFEVRAPDYHLLPGSPCVDAGEARDAPSADLDGVARPAWGAVDVGAYEYVGAEPPSPLPQFVRGNANDDGKVNIADAIFILQYLFSRGSPPPCLEAADANDGGAIDIGDGIAVLGALFGGRKVPLPAPRDYCGVDPTPDALGCASYRSCLEPQ